MKIGVDGALAVAFCCAFLATAVPLRPAEKTCSSASSCVAAREEAEVLLQRKWNGSPEVALAEVKQWPPKAVVSEDMDLLSMRGSPPSEDREGWIPASEAFDDEFGSSDDMDLADSEDVFGDLQREQRQAQFGYGNPDDSRFRMVNRLPEGGALGNREPKNAVAEPEGGNRAQDGGASYNEPPDSPMSAPSAPVSETENSTPSASLGNGAEGQAALVADGMTCPSEFEDGTMNWPNMSLLQCVDYCASTPTPCSFFTWYVNDSCRVFSECPGLVAVESAELPAQTFEANASAMQVTNAAPIPLGNALAGSSSSNASVAEPVANISNVSTPVSNLTSKAEEQVAQPGAFSNLLKKAPLNDTSASNSGNSSSKATTPAPNSSILSSGNLPENVSANGTSLVGPDNLSSNTTTPIPPDGAVSSEDLQRNGSASDAGPLDPDALFWNTTTPFPVGGTPSGENFPKSVSAKDGHISLNTTPVPADSAPLSDELPKNESTKESNSTDRGNLSENTTASLPVDPATSGKDLPSDAPADIFPVNTNNTSQNITTPIPIDSAAQSEQIPKNESTEESDLADIDDISGNSTTPFPDDGVFSNVTTRPSRERSADGGTATNPSAEQSAVEPDGEEAATPAAMMAGYSYRRYDGRYLYGFADGDASPLSEQEAQARCDELGERCGGFTCLTTEAETICTVRAGGFPLLSEAGETSYLQLCPTYAASMTDYSNCLVEKCQDADPSLLGEGDGSSPLSCVELSANCDSVFSDSILVKHLCPVLCSACAAPDEGYRMGPETIPPLGSDPRAPAVIVPYDVGSTASSEPSLEQPAKPSANTSNAMTQRLGDVDSWGKETSASLSKPSNVTSGQSESDSTVDALDSRRRIAQNASPQVQANASTPSNTSIPVNASAAANASGAANASVETGARSVNASRTEEPCEIDTKIECSDSIIPFESVYCPDDMGSMTCDAEGGTCFCKNSCWVRGRCEPRRNSAANRTSVRSLVATHAAVSRLPSAHAGV